MNLRHTIFLVFALISLQLAAQTERPKNIANAKDIKYFSLSDPYLLKSHDTVLHFFQRYLVGDTEWIPWRNLGNAGTAYFPLVFDLDSRPGFDLGWHQYDLYERKLLDIHHYQIPTPYTYLKYVQGPKKEQIFHVKHARNIGKQISIGADYEVIGSEGYYARQKSSLDIFNVYLHLNSKNRKYHLFTGYLVNDIDNEQNGGIDSTLVTDADVFTTSRPEFLPVNLSSAVSDWNTRTYYLQQSYSLGGKFIYELNDTTQREVYYSKVNFFHHINYKTSRYGYQDAIDNQGFYPEFLLARDSTNDLTKTVMLQNRFALQFSGIKERTADTVIYTKYRAFAYLDHQIIGIEQQGRKYNTDNLTVRGSIQNNTINPGKLTYNLDGEFVLAGYNNGDYQFKGSVGYFQNQWIGFRAFASFAKNAPPFIYEQYLSNHFYWENTFGKQKTLQLGAEYNIPRLKMKIAGKYFRMSNYLYFESNRMPAQASETIRGFVLDFKQHLQAGNWHLDNYVAFQSFTGDEINMPAFVTKNSFYWSNQIFKGALLTHLGFDVRFNSTFQADSFDPVTGQFLNQDTDNISTYWVIDVFANLQLKRARLFFKLENVNQSLLWFPDGYYSAPGYPSQPFGFRFGIDWIFFD